jgi:hypothetical protein
LTVDQAAIDPMLSDIDRLRTKIANMLIQLFRRYPA